VSPVPMIVAFMSHLDAKHRRRQVKALRAGLNSCVVFHRGEPSRGFTSGSRWPSKPVARLELPFESIPVAFVYRR
jgi:hypothetical protein